MLAANAPVDTEEAARYFSCFYEPVAGQPGDDLDRPTTRRRSCATTFDRSSPIAQYATVPRAFVFIQRINLGLYAILGRLGATGNYRRISEELWPMVDGPPSTPMGVAEAGWLGGVKLDPQVGAQGAGDRVAG